MGDKEVVINNDKESFILNNEIKINENQNEIKDIDLNPKKIVLNKNVRPLKNPPLEKKQILKEEVPNIEIEINNEDNFIKSIESVSENQNKGMKNEDIINNENNKLSKGYLDEDLEDEDNKKLYLRVIKRMEKTYDVPIIHAEIQGEQIEDIEIEENIRPILINNNNKDNISKKIESHLNTNKNEINNNSQKNVKPKSNKNTFNVKIISNKNNIRKIASEDKNKSNTPLNNNRIANSQNICSLNISNKANIQYTNKYSMYNKFPKYGYVNQYEKKKMSKSLQPTNLYKLNHQIQFPNNNKKKYSAGNQSFNIQNKQNSKSNNIIHNTRYQNYLNNNNIKRDNNYKINNYRPLKDQFYYNYLGKSQSIFNNAQKINIERFNNCNNSKKAYNNYSNQLNKGNLKGKTNTQFNNNILYSNSIHFNNKSPIIPKRENFQYNSSIVKNYTQYTFFWP